MANSIQVAKNELFNFWNSLCNFNFHIENTDFIVFKLQLFHGNVGSSEYNEYISRINAKFALCFNTSPPIVFIPEENLLRILNSSMGSLDEILKNYKTILRHEYGHCLFYEEMIKTYPNEKELHNAYQINNDNNARFLQIHQCLQFVSTYEASKHYYSTVPNEVSANKLADINLFDLINAEEYLRGCYSQL